MSLIGALGDEPLQVVLDELVGCVDALPVLRVTPHGRARGIEVERVAPGAEALCLLVVGGEPGRRDEAVILTDREIPEREHVRTVPTTGERRSRALDERLTVDLPRTKLARAFHRTDPRGEAPGDSLE